MKRTVKHGLLASTFGIFLLIPWILEKLVPGFLSSTYDPLESGRLFDAITNPLLPIILISMGLYVAFFVKEPTEEASTERDM